MLTESRESGGGGSARAGSQCESEAPAAGSKGGEGIWIWAAVGLSTTAMGRPHGRGGVSKETEVVDADQGVGQRGQQKAAPRPRLVIKIGDVPVRVNTADPPFQRLLRERYAGYIADSDSAEMEFDVELIPPQPPDSESEVRVTLQSGRWLLTRGDFRAEWEPASRRGWIRQSANPYSIDCVLRIVHTLVLARQGGFLLHSASAIRNRKAFLFAGVSGAGKTTISRLAPGDATVLTDEISYVRRQKGGYVAFGTPFTGELGKRGENVSAPLAALYLLAQGPENRIEAISPAEAVRGLLANILFFAEDEDLVRSMFDSAFEFISRVPVHRLTFVPDARVWELIG